VTAPYRGSLPSDPFDVRLSKLKRVWVGRGVDQWPTRPAGPGRLGAPEASPGVWSPPPVPSDRKRPSGGPARIQAAKVPHAGPAPRWPWRAIPEWGWPGSSALPPGRRRDRANGLRCPQRARGVGAGRNLTHRGCQLSRTAARWMRKTTGGPGLSTPSSRYAYVTPPAVRVCGGTCFQLTGEGCRSFIAW